RARGRVDLPIDVILPEGGAEIERAGEKEHGRDEGDDALRASRTWSHVPAPLLNPGVSELHRSVPQVETPKGHPGRVREVPPGPRTLPEERRPPISAAGDHWLAASG